MGLYKPGNQSSILIECVTNKSKREWRSSKREKLQKRYLLKKKIMLNNQYCTLHIWIYHHHHNHHHHHLGLNPATRLARQSSRDCISNFLLAPKPLSSVSMNVVDGCPRSLCPCNGSHSTAPRQAAVVPLMIYRW